MVWLWQSVIGWAKTRGRREPVQVSWPTDVWKGGIFL